VHGNSNPFTGPKPTGIPFPPVGSRRAIVKKVRVNVDQHPALPLLLLLIQVALNPSESNIVLPLRRKIEVGLFGLLLFQHAVLVIDIVEIVDGWLPW